MSTIEDFENAPIGATATHDKGTRVMKTGDMGRNWVTPGGSHLDTKEMVYWGYTLDPVAPTTAREALALAWELAHPVNSGDVIPKDMTCLQDNGDFITMIDRPTNWTPAFPESVRTLEPLPETEPEPDWLDAPAILAWSRWDDVRREKVWSKDDECYKSTNGETIDWQDLSDVTPLWPKETDDE